MNNFRKTHSEKTGTPFLKSKHEIIFETYLFEIQLSFLAMLFGMTTIYIVRNYVLQVVTLPDFAHTAILIPITFLSTILMFWKPTVQNFSISYTAIISTNIALCIWHIMTGQNNFVHSLMLFSLPYFALGVLSATIIPKTIKTLLPIHFVALVVMFINNSGGYELEVNTFILLSFIFNIIVIIFFYMIMNSTDQRIIKLTEKQRAQLDELSFTEGLLNFALTETKQTIIFHDADQITQHPQYNEFTHITKSVDHNLDFTSNVMDVLAQNGYHTANIQDYTITTPSKTQLLKDSFDNSYFATSSVTPDGKDAILLTKVSGLIRSGRLLNAALNGIRLGVLCYDENGRLMMSRGSTIDSRHDDIFNSFNSFNSKISKNKTHITNFKLGDKCYDFSIMKYGDINFIAHIDVTARANHKAQTSIGLPQKAAE